MLNVNPVTGWPLGRRRVLAMLGGVAVSGLFPARWAQAGAGAASALAFDGDALVVAGAQLWRHDLSGASATGPQASACLLVAGGW